MHKNRYTVALIAVLLTAMFYSAYLMKIFAVAESGGKTVTVVLKSLNVRSDFWQTVAAGAQVAAKQAGAEIELAGPLVESDTDGQIKALQEAIARKPDAIVVAPFADSRLPGITAQIREAGIAIVVIDTPLDIAPGPAYVGNDHEEAGRLAGEKATLETGGRPVAAILSDYNYSVISELRKTGTESYLAKMTDNMIGTYYSGGSEDRACDIAQQLIRDYPKLNVLVTLSESATLGAARAIKESGAKSVKLIGFESSVKEIQLLEEGLLNATIVQKPFNMGYLGVKTALDLAGGKKTGSQYIASTVVTRENMYTPEIQKLLFPFTENH